MLPGFRFLVAAIVFSLSILVFGLGAAALFRAAHEQFASSSSWRMTPEGSYTSFLPPAEPPWPVIAMLRVEPLAANAPAPEPHPDLLPTDAPTGTPATSADAADTMPAIVASPTTDAAPVPAQEAMIAADPPAPAAETSVVAVIAPVTASADVDNAEAAKPKTLAAVPPLAPPATPDAAMADRPKPDGTTTGPAAPSFASLPPVATTRTAIARQDALPVFAEAQVLTSTAVVTSDASNATPLPAPAPSRSELLAQMIALSADRAITTEHKASIRTASLHLRQSLAKKRQAKERAARERLAEARRAKRQREMAQRARAARQTAAAQQQQQFADPFAQPQGFGGQQAFGQQAAQPR
jgi:hypothetical protein